LRSSAGRQYRQCGGATPDATGDAIVLSAQLDEHSAPSIPDNATLTAEAGVRWPRSSRRRPMPTAVPAAAEGSCTIGGNLSTNAGGTAVLRFGNTRELVLGIEVVLADGRVWNGLRALRKDNTGYDLKQLFIGAEGTLGIVTAAVLKLFPAPRTRVTALAAVADVAAAVRLLSALRQTLGDRLTGFELMSAHAISLSRKHQPDLPDPLPGYPWYALVQADDTATHSPLESQVERALNDAMEGDIARRDACAVSRAGGRPVGVAREHRRGPAPRRSNIKHDISVPVSAIPFWTRPRSRLTAASSGRARDLGHLGDGNLPATCRPRARRRGLHG
jgi:FAD/FMN-containing dehydrogenase